MVSKWTFGDSNPGPTGYEPVALTNWAKGPYSLIFKSDSDGNRTRVTAVKGRCLNRLTTEPKIYAVVSTTMELYNIFYGLSTIILFFRIIFSIFSNAFFQIQWVTFPVTNQNITLIVNIPLAHSAFIVPPIRSTSSLVIASPSPLPLALVRALSAL